LNLAGFNLTNGGIITGTTVSGTFMYGNAASFTTLTVGGVAITGSAASSDRITSGTDVVVVNGSTDTVSFTLGGGTPAYIHPTLGLVAVGVSTTGRISGTNGYFSGSVGIGTTAPARTLQVGNADGIMQVGNPIGALLSGDDSGIGLFGTNLYVDASANLKTASTQGAYGYAGVSAAAGNVDVYTATGATTADATVTPVSRLRVNSAGNVGINTTSPNARLEVNGTISATGVSITGIVSATRFVGDGSGLTGIGGNDNLGNHTATQALNLATFNINNVGVVTATTVSGTNMYGLNASFTTIFNAGSFSGNSIAANSTSSTLVSASNVSATLIQVGASTATCTSSISGSVRWGTASNTLQICTGSGWVSLVSGTSAGGASALSGLSDVTVSNISGRDYLRYDAGTSKWVNISESTIMSTTTMASGWPDAIRCVGASGSANVSFAYGNAAGTTAVYMLMGDYGTVVGGSANAPTLNFSSPTAAGSLTETASWTGWLTNCSGKTISQLYASGQAFNFIGGNSRWQDVSGFSYLNANSVGIGVATSSTAALDVAGMISATGLTQGISAGLVYGRAASLTTITGGAST
ncbi:MAG: hypothetical protein EBQ80_00125, partial [Proteobacteria bacterium]|nr:hypothetical protein [Pseudomonadota bacterium]